MIEHWLDGVFEEAGLPVSGSPNRFVRRNVFRSLDSGECYVVEGVDLPASSKRIRQAEMLEDLFEAGNHKVVKWMRNRDGRFGIYDHGLYPFFFDKLYTVQGSPCGFGLVDAMKGTQSQIDRLSDAIVKNAELASRVRYFIRTDGSVNEEEFADFTKPLVHVQGSRLGEDSLRQIKVQSLDPLYVSILANKINELKETSGNRDFSQGGTSAGVTAASAIAALQEAGSKLSRDMIGASYRAFAALVKRVIALIGEN